MHRSRIVFVVTLGALVLGCGAALLLQRGRLAVLRIEIADARERYSDAQRLQAENAKLAAAQPPAEELERLRADHAATRRLRTELEALKRAAKAPVPQPDGKPQRVLAEGMFAPGKKAPASEWKNVGRATPLAAFETLLWAATAGDIDALAGGLVIDPFTRKQLDKLWSELSDASRQQYASPDLLVAALTAKDIPLGTAQVFGEHRMDSTEAQAHFPAPTTMIVARVAESDKSGKTISLTMRETADGWRAVLPSKAVEKYRESLQPPIAGR